MKTTILSSFLCLFALQASTVRALTSKETPENTLSSCKDKIDNDNDSFVDCTDQDCLIFAHCVQKKNAGEPGSTSADSEIPEIHPQNDFRHRPVSLAIAPYVTTDGGSDEPVLNNFTLSLVGWGDRLHGLDLSILGAIRRDRIIGVQSSGLFNYAHQTVGGAQLSGLSNVATGGLRGLQGSGLANISLGTGVHGFQMSGLINVSNNTRGFQGAGLSNFTRLDISGIQASGLANVSLGNTRGMQVAGIANVSGSDTSGFQGSGLSNISVDTLRGFQGTGGANYARGGSGAQVSGLVNLSTDEFKGVQIGLFNYATNMTGAQIGLINIASKKMKGASVGLVNYAGDGVLAGRFWVSDNSLMNVGLKMGSENVYSILGYGVHPLGKKGGDALIAGLGGHIPLTKKLWMDVDLTHYWMHDDFKWNDTDSDYEIKLGATLGIRLVNALSLFAGPSLDLVVSSERKRSSIIDYEFSNGKRGGSTIALSPGFVAGIQIHPTVGDLNSK